MPTTANSSSWWSFPARAIWPRCEDDGGEGHREEQLRAQRPTRRCGNRPSALQGMMDQVCLLVGAIAGFAFVK